MLEQPVTLESPVNQRHLTAMFIVDTGATYSLVPKQDVEYLQLPPAGNARVLTANGVVTMPVYASRLVTSGETVDTYVMVNPTGVRVLGLDAIRKIGLYVVPPGTNGGN